MQINGREGTAGQYLAVTIQLNAPLTLTLSPSDREREHHIAMLAASSLFGEHSKVSAIFSLSPSDGERAGVGEFLTASIRLSATE
jgi:hypothetical protein